MFIERTDRITAESGQTQPQMGGSCFFAWLQNRFFIVYFCALKTYLVSTDEEKQVLCSGFISFSKNLAGLIRNIINFNFLYIDPSILAFDFDLIFGSFLTFLGFNWLIFGSV